MEGQEGILEGQLIRIALIFLGFFGFVFFVWFCFVNCMNEYISESL